MTTATRPIMTAAELRTFQVSQYGRDYRESDDGYSDMEAEEGRGWRSVAGWGRDGWDLGNWPYVIVYFRKFEDEARPFGLMQICEGDRTVYAFPTQEDLYAATDYLFLWYSADERWSPVTWETREQLDKGELPVPEKFRGPYRG